MTTFGLVTEGVSEHRVIKHLLQYYFKGHDIIPNQIQPKLIGDKQDNNTPGGWKAVLDCCKSNRLEDILVDNDYIVIQIDTDQSQEIHFDVPHRNSSGRGKTHEELYNDVCAKLLSLIPEPIREKYKDRIIFAISIHTIECWLLAPYYTDNKREKVTGCVGALNIAIAKQNTPEISEKDKNNQNSRKAYEAILSNFKKKARIIEYAQYNYGFQKFIWNLDSIAPPVI